MRVMEELEIDNYLCFFCFFVTRSMFLLSAFSPSFSVSPSYWLPERTTKKSF